MIKVLRLQKLSHYLKKLLSDHTLLLSLLIAASLIIVSTGLGWYNNKVVPVTTNPIARYTAEPNNPLSFMSNWDGPDYISIAQKGYQNVSQASFFPLYPLLIHILTKLINSPLISALIISWFCLVGAIYFFIKILRKLFKTENNLMSLKGLIFFVLFPTSVFLVATYTESLLAFLSLGAIYYALNRKYLYCTAFMIVACAVHLDAILVLILVCLLLLEEKVHVSKVILSFILSLLGLITYSVYLQDKFASPLAFILSQKSHGWLNHHYTEIFQSINFFNIVFICLLILAAVYFWQRRRSFSYYSLLFLLIPIIGNQFGGFNRYVLLAFPVQFMAYDYLKNKHLAFSLTMAMMGIIWAYFALQYTGGYIGG